jgi:hypothetical protein
MTKMLNRIAGKDVSHFFKEIYLCQATIWQGIKE